MIEFFQNNAFLISQIFMLFAMILDILSFKKTTKTWILYFLIPSTIFIWLHYFLLWKTAVSLIYVVAFSRLLISTFIQEEWNRKDMVHTFLIIQSTIFIVFFDKLEPLSLLAYVAHCLFIMWTFQRSDRELRLSFMAWTVLLIIYNIFIFTPIWVLSETIYLITNIIYFKKFFLNKKIDKKGDFDKIKN